MKRPLLLLLSLTAALAAMACVTINVYFPEAAVKDLSEQIEEAILLRAEANEAPAPEDSEPEDAAQGEQTGSLFEALEIGLGAALRLLPAPEVHAQGETVAAPEISNPAIRQIINSRSTRVQEISRHKGSGVLGESNKALLEVRNLDALALRERAAVQKLVREENADRERMFKEIAAATGTDLSQLPQIQATYAETLRAKARKGDWIQLPNGQWQQK